MMLTEKQVKRYNNRFWRRFSWTRMWLRHKAAQRGGFYRYDRLLAEDYDRYMALVEQLKARQCDDVSQTQT